MAKQIIQGAEARKLIRKGIDTACDAVRPTLGAVGMTALIEFPGLDPIDCDDGVTVLRNIELENQFENMGVQMLRKGAMRTSVEGGDGTATTTVLTQALVAAAFDELGDNSSRIREVRERLQNGLVEAIKLLSELKRDVADEDIERIANISSLDPEVAKLIAEIIREVGVNGVVTVERGQKIGYTSEVVKGARFPAGLISPFFINDAKTNSCVLEDVYVVLVDRRVSTNEQIVGLLNSIGTGKAILFIATDVDSVALGTLAYNAQQKIASIAAVKNPYNATPGRDFLFDIAALTGATVISEEKGMKLDEMKVTVCGRAAKVIVTRDSTTIIPFPETLTAELDSRIQSINDNLGTTTSEYDKVVLEERLARLTGGIGVIRVGAYTDTEFNAKRYKFDNAINATQAALQEGILPGGGVALAMVADMHSDKMFRALLAPMKQMSENAQAKSLYGKTVDDEDFEGCNFKTKEQVRMFEAGIIDPFKVTRLALESAVAIAASLVSIETAIITKKDEPKRG